MLRSLFSGVSGLTNHQLILDATANNLANISTTGFKGSRVSFSTALTQTQSAGSSPGDTAGGINPRQIGLGVRNSSLDIDMRQGALNSTGRTFDLAVQGNGFFRVVGSDGTAAYTRVGNFGFDAQDNLVDLGSGMMVQGHKLDSTGKPTGDRTAITTAENKSINAKATEQVRFQGNLSTDAEALRGTKLSSVLPIRRKDTGAAAIESTALSTLSMFAGNPVNPGIQLSNTFDASATNLTGGTEAALNRSTTLTSDGRLRVTIVLPAADYSTNPTTLRLREGTIASGTVHALKLINSDLSAASEAQRTVVLEGTATLDDANQVNITAEPTANITSGNFTVSTQVLKTIHAFGTKPNGDAWAGSFTIDPWQDTVQQLVSGINSVLAQGSDTFASVKLENGELKATSVGDQQGFSLFLGEKSPLSTIADMTPNATSLAATNFSYDGSGTALARTPLSGSGWRAAAGSGSFNSLALNVTGADYSAAVTTPTVTVYRNGVQVATGTIPANDYSTTAPAAVALSGAVAVTAGDVITYAVHGNWSGAPTSTAPATIALTPSIPVGVSASPSLSYGTSNLGSTRTSSPLTVAATDAGMLKPTVRIPDGTYTGTLNVKVKVGTKELGTLTIPAGTYNSTNNSFTINSLPHVKSGDQITYSISGTMDLGGGALFFDSGIYRDSDTQNMTSDTFSAGGTAAADGIPDMFQENGPVDLSAWQYDKDSNSTFNWYRMRFVPESVDSSIQVYDSVGGSHTLETRFFRTGTRSVTEGNQTVRYNSWDMVVNVSPLEGTLQDDLLTGIEFDNKGQFVGNGRLGTTVNGNSMSDGSRFVGTPSDDSLTINWAATGPSSFTFDLGDAASTNGLTGFGSSSTALAIEQDGYSSGNLDSLSVTGDGSIVGLYSNGKSLSLYQLEIAVFRNPGGLSSIGNNLWQVSANSGDPLSRTGGQGGAGSVTSGALEGSNVDIASEFTRLITAQRGFQVNSRVIQTTDQILQELTSLIRG